MKKKRIRYDYWKIIFDNKLEKQFSHYSFHHPKIKSQRRLMRNFLLSLGYNHIHFLNATLERAIDEKTIEYAKTPWLDE